MNDTQKGFTLIELLVVIAIIIIATLIIIRVTSVLKDTRDSKRIATLHQIRDTLEKFKLKYGRYPAIDQTLGTDTFSETWYHLGQCLLKEEDCWSNITPASARPYGGATIPNFESDLSKWENDPLNKNPDVFAYDDSTYWTNYSCIPSSSDPNYDGINYGYILVAFPESPIEGGVGGDALLGCYNDEYCDSPWVYCLKENWD